MNNQKYLERVLFLILYLIGLFFIFQYLGHSILQHNDVDVLLFSSLTALAINILVISCFFETPKDVVASSINVLILLSGLYLSNNFPRSLLNILLLYATFCLVISTTSIIFYNSDGNTGSIKQQISNTLKKISVAIGSSRIIFSILIGVLLITAYSQEDYAFYVFIGMALILLVNEPIRQLILSVFSFICSFFHKRMPELSDPVGYITAVQGKDTFILNLIDINKRPSLKLFDFVHFKYGTDNLYFRGCIIDRYCLDSQQQIKVLKISSINITDSNKKDFLQYVSNVAYKIKNPDATETNFLEKFVGIVIENSDISQIKFEYSSKKILSNGDLLAIRVKNKKEEYVDVLYQITQARTNIKALESRNEVGLIQATATQLGVWQTDTRNFENYGWVPTINTPVMLADNIKGPSKQAGEIQIGTIEDTDFNVLVKANDLVTHHAAILGTTGSGKSVFARKLIKELACSGDKIFCIDFTGEVKKFLKNIELIDTSSQISVQGVGDRKISGYIKWIVDENAKFANQRHSKYNDVVIAIEKHIKSGLKTFIEDTSNNIGVFELPELSNTEETLEYTKDFFKSLFDLAKEGIFKEKRACIMLEEAHTLIPEWNSVGGTDDKTARRLTNTIAQIALQGRKYNVGLLVIAQRTANVSKTILTQCNTIISFKQFDNTGKDFLINHFGGTFVESLSILKNRRAIIAGKALISDVPIIFKVPDISEEKVQIIEETSKEKEQNGIKKPILSTETITVPHDFNV